MFDASTATRTALRRHCSEGLDHSEGILYRYYSSISSIVVIGNDDIGSQAASVGVVLQQQMQALGLARATDPMQQNGVIPAIEHACTLIGELSDRIGVRIHRIYTCTWMHHIV